MKTEKKLFTMMLSPEDRKKLERLAFREDRSLANYLTVLIRKEAEKLDK